MRKKYLLLLSGAVSFPQTTLAHFETSHQSFWYEPMHWLFQHYAVSTLIGLGVIGAVIYVKKALKVNSEK